MTKDAFEHAGWVVAVKNKLPSGETAFGFSSYEGGREVGNSIMLIYENRAEAIAKKRSMNRKDMVIKRVSVAIK